MTIHSAIHSRKENSTVSWTLEQLLVQVVQPTDRLKKSAVRALKQSRIKGEINHLRDDFD